MIKRKILVGARGSLLSVAQAKGVIKILKREFPAHSFSLKKIVTLGDRHKNWQRQDMGIFVKEIEQALLDGEIDLAIHSMKDLPTQIPSRLKLAAVPKRLDPRDCLIFKERTSLSKLKKGACIGTSSLRRQSQVLRVRPDLRIKGLRGNLDTRMRKLTEGEFDAIIVALAGVTRLGAAAGDFFIQPIPASLILPAPGQGALGIEIRSGDKLIEALAQRINHQKSLLCVSCERAFLRELGSGCRLALGALAEIKHRQIHLQAIVLSNDGRRAIRLNAEAPLKDGEALGESLAQECLRRGGRELLKEVDRK